MGYQDEVRARRKRQKVQNIQTYLTNPDLIAQRLGRLGVETPLPALPAATGSGRIYKPTPNLGTMIAGGAPAPTAVAAPPMPAPLVGLRPGQRATAGPAPYEQMIARRGYAEPISPMGAYNRREATATVPGANPPILYSPETEAIADRIMGEEQAAFAERNRWRRMAAENLKAVQSPAQAGYSFGFQGDVPTAQVSGLDAAGRPAVMMPTRLAPRPEEPPAETPAERVARIQQAIEEGTAATQYRRAGPGEPNALSTYTLDVARAMAGEGKMPAPFVGRMPDQQITGLGAAMARPEGQVKITPDERQAKRQTEMDIRSRIAESNRVGRPITRQQAAMMARLEGKVNRGEELTPMETISTMSPEQQAILGPEGFAAIMESDPKRLKAAEKAAQLSALAQTAGAYAKAGKETPTWIIDAMSDIGGGAGGRASDKGGPITIPGAAPPPVVPPEETAGHAALDDVRSAVLQRSPLQQEALETAIQNGDVETLQRIAQLAGIDAMTARKAAEQTQRARGYTWEIVNDRMGIGQWVPITP